MHRINRSESAIVPMRTLRRPASLIIEPYISNSEPNTPVFTTNQLPLEAEPEWFAIITSKEWNAVMTFETIPSILRETDKDHKTTSATELVSPRLLPLLERCKFFFARGMAKARWEAEQGSYKFPADENSTEAANPDEEYKKANPIISSDVLSAFEVEAFLARIEEICLPGKESRVIFRRYWRISYPPFPDIEPTLGGVISSGSTAEVHQRTSILASVRDHWDDIPKVLIAEFKIRADGTSYGGRNLRET